MADRKCGEWLKDNIKKGNPSGVNQREFVRSRDITLQKLDITKNESSRLQKIASIPEDRFEEVPITQCLGVYCNLISKGVLS